MKLIGGLVAVLLGAALMPATQASAAWEANPATSCSTVERGKGYVTKIKWHSGETTRVRNMRSETRKFPGRRLVLWNRERPGKRVTKCLVQRDGTVVLRTNGGARIEYYQPDPPPDTRPVESYGRWAGPVTFHSTLPAEWGVAEAVAAWNEGAGQLSMQAEPCGTNPSCISIGIGPMVTAGGLGEAYPVANASGMLTSCAVVVEASVPTEWRRSTVAHEVGHCLGLTHWDYEGSIMFHEADGWVDLPSRYDLEWLASS